MQGASPCVAEDDATCTIVACDENGDGCLEPAIDDLCDDDDACTADVCDPDDPGAEAGTGCVNEGIDCDDSIDCTDDGCDPDTGCLNTPVDADCNDSLVCTGPDTCEPGTGCAHPGVSCGDDAYTCTVASCVEPTGCRQTPTHILCDDDDECTADSCDPLDAGADPLTGCVNEDIDCTDAVACTNDGCNPVTGCVNTPVDASCADAYACTTDTCDAIAGCSNTPVNAACSDGVACTTDTCNPASGCVNTPVNAACNDSLACTGPDTCILGTGCSRPAVTCSDDAFTCTVAECVEPGGCRQTEEDALCNDSNPNTTDVCDPATGDPVTGCTHTLTCNSLCNGAAATDCGPVACGYMLLAACLDDCGTATPWDEATMDCVDAVSLSNTCANFAALCSLVDSDPPDDIGSCPP